MEVVNLVHLDFEEAKIRRNPSCAMGLHQFLYTVYIAAYFQSHWVK